MYLSWTITRTILEDTSLVISSCICSKRTPSSAKVVLRRAPSLVPDSVPSEGPNTLLTRDSSAGGGGAVSLTPLTTVLIVAELMVVGAVCSQ